MRVRNLARGRSPEEPPASRRSPGLESWCRRGISGSRGASAAPSPAGCGTASPGHPPSALRSREERAASGPPRLSSLLPSPNGGGESRGGRGAHPPPARGALPAPNAVPSSPLPAPAAATVLERRGVSHRARAPPAAAARVRSRPPGARRARPIPGGGRTGSRCSAQRRLHPQVWSQARRGPAGGGGGGIGGGILRLPRPPPRPPSSLLFHRLRAPLTGPSS